MLIQRFGSDLHASTETEILSKTSSIINRLLNNKSPSYLFRQSYCDLDVGVARLA